MSVRAYRVVLLETEDSPLFNLSYDEFIAETLNIYSQLTDDGTGIATIFIEDVRYLKSEHKKKKKEFTAEDNSRYEKIIEALEKAVEESQYGELQIYCN